MRKKLIATFLVFALLLTSFLAVSPSDSASAATDISKQFSKASAKKIVEKALKTLKNSSGICYECVSITNFSKADNKPTAYRYINGFSTSSCDYYMAFDKKETEKAWFGYNIKGKVFRKSFSDTAYKVYDNKVNYNPDFGTDKNYLEYMLAHLTSEKVKSITSKTYVISAKPGWDNADITSINITINRKTNKILKIKCKKAKKTYTYINSTDKYTVIGGTYTYSKIGYGDFTISIPDELAGYY